MGDDVHFPGLVIAARRLGLDASELAEAMLCRLDAGESYWSALHNVVAEAAQRKGIYDGLTKAQIDGGDVFASRKPLPPIETGGRMLEAMADSRVDAFDLLALAGVRSPKAHAEEHERARAESLEAVAMDEGGEK